MSDIAGKLEVDDWGRVVVNSDTALELLLADKDVNTLYVEDDEGLQRYNKMCLLFDKPEEMISAIRPLPISPEIYHEEQSQRWLSASPDDSLWDDLLAKCQTDIERNRFLEEFEEFNNRKMLPILAQLYSMVQTLDRNNVIRGVGRGSSVASFILYLMEVHFINPIEHNLDLSEFLK